MVPTLTCESVNPVNVWTTVTTSGNPVACWAQCRMGSQRGPLSIKGHLGGYLAPRSITGREYGKEAPSGGSAGTWASSHAHSQEVSLQWEGEQRPEAQNLCRLSLGREQLG